MDIPGNNLLENINEFELYDFTGDANFCQFIDQIRGEYEDPVANFDYDLIINDSLFYDNQFVSNHENFYGFDTTTMVAQDPNSLVITVPNIDAEMVAGDLEENDDGEDSSGTTTTTTATITTKPSKRPKVDRGRTLISERKRRGRMKEKLYALRSLIPNITKVNIVIVINNILQYFCDLTEAHYTYF